MAKKGNPDETDRCNRVYGVSYKTAYEKDVEVLPRSRYCQTGLDLIIETLGPSRLTP